MLRRNKRIHGRKTIKNIIENGDLKKMRFFVARSLPNEEAHNRYAIAISKKLDKRATARNRKRRQVYSAIQAWHTRQGVQDGPASDIVLLARTPLMKASFEEISEEIHKLLSE